MYNQIYIYLYIYKEINKFRKMHISAYQNSNATNATRMVNENEEVRSSPVSKKILQNG